MRRNRPSILTPLLGIAAATTAVMAIAPGSARPQRPAQQPVVTGTLLPNPHNSYPLENNLLGTSVAVFDDGVMGGAPKSNGLGVFRGGVDTFRFFNGSWREDAVSGMSGAMNRLMVPHSLLTSDHAWFGQAMSASGTVVAIGAPGAALADSVDDVTETIEPWLGVDPSPDVDAGVVVIARRRAGGWQLTGTIRLNESTTLLADASHVLQDRAKWQFGRSVSLTSAYLTVGAPYANVRSSPGATAQPEVGAVVVYKAVGQGWEPEAILTPSDLNTSHWPHAANGFEYFGHSVSISGTRLAIGAPNAEMATEDINFNAGAVHIFEKDASGQWRHKESLTPSGTDRQENGWFGKSVAASGGELLVGQPGHDRPATIPQADLGRGIAWLYTQTEPSPNVFVWNGVPWFPPSSEPQPFFGMGYGSAVALSYQLMAIGAPGGDWLANNVSFKQGTAYVWNRFVSTAGWSGPDVLSPGVQSDQWGQSVSVDNTRAAIGGWLTDVDTHVNSGQLVTWTPLGPGPPSSIDDCDGDGVHDQIQLVAGAADCNGNGILDICELCPPGSILWSRDCTYCESAMHGGVALVEPSLNQNASNHFYRVFDARPDGQTWDEAQLTAWAAGSSGRLATIDFGNAADTAAAEGALLARLNWSPNTNGTLWLGGLQIAPVDTDDTWAWTGGGDWTWTNWATGEPDDLDGTENGQEDRLLVEDEIAGYWTWADSNINTLAAGHVQEFDPDCDCDLQLDECQITLEPDLDLNANGRLDTCEIIDDPTLDCDGNNLLDAWEIATDPSLDCDGSLQLDACELTDGLLLDCDANGIPDICDGQPPIILNEVHADPASGIGTPPGNVADIDNGDANGDGVRDSSDDEFLELVNVSPVPINLQGWTLTVNSVIRHTFSSLTVQPGCAAVVFGGPTPATGRGTFEIRYMNAPLLGACCNDDLECSLGEQIDCDSLGGLYQGDGSSCLQDPCLPDNFDNDECLDAIEVFEGRHSFSTINATPSIPIPIATCDTVDLGWTSCTPDIWFWWEAPTTGFVDLTICDTTPYNSSKPFDTLLVLYEADDAQPICEGLVQVGCNDDGAIDIPDICFPYDSVIHNALVEAGKTYYIRIGSKVSPEPIPRINCAAVQISSECGLALPCEGTIELHDNLGLPQDSVTWAAPMTCFNQSITRWPDICGPWVLHRDEIDGSEQNWSPGANTNGTAFCLCFIDDDSDGIQDSIDNCEFYNPDQNDCDGDGIGDVCEVVYWVADGGDLADIDCDFNFTPDNCELNVFTDCDANGVLDTCEIAADITLDCNANGILDSCDILSGVDTDCNANGIPDWCDINLYHTSDDTNGDGFPDECFYDPQCDLNNDGTSDIQDFLDLLGSWGCVDQPGVCTGDFDGDGDVDINDLLGYSSNCQ